MQPGQWYTGMFIAWSALLRTRIFVLVWSRRWEYNVRCCWKEDWNKKSRDSGNLTYWKVAGVFDWGCTIVGLLARAFYLKNSECHLALILIFISQLCMRVEKVEKLIIKPSVQNMLLSTSIFTFNLSTSCSLQVIDTQASRPFLSIPGI